MTPDEIAREFRRRADHYLAQTHLHVDYYRVRRRLAYELPVRRFHISEVKLTGLSSTYPWATWMSWALEERLGCLGWVGTHQEDAAARAAVNREVDALAAWPAWRQYEKPDLSLGHAARTLWLAYTQCGWLDAAVRKNVEAAFARMVADTEPLSAQLHGALRGVEDVLSQPEPHKVLHNIPIIGTIGAALAAHASGHPAGRDFNARLAVLLRALLEHRRSGFCEGVAYDGYVMDFALDWFAILNPAERAAFLEHPQFARLLDESVLLSAPGDVLRVAELSDVEPYEMSFHASAHAKTWRYRPTPLLGWYLSRARLAWLRSGALAALHPVASQLQGTPPPAGALDAHYALVLRSGYAAEDLAVAMAASACPMGHIHHDNGSIVLGTRECWLISDPGYQQYREGDERVFTLGVQAHNAPVINGRAQEAKGIVRRALEGTAGGLCRAELDLTACYAPALKLRSVTRTLWLSGRKFAVVADRSVGAGEGVESLTYHWHGHPEAAWWVEEGWARLVVDGAVLWFTCPQAKLHEAQVDRHPGSRGQLTLSAPADPRAPAVFWVFALGARRPALALDSGGHGVTVNGTAFRVPD